MTFRGQLVVIDTETTGLGKADRICEFAAVVIDLQSGNIVEEFDTLVNPMRNIGNSFIHGITSATVSAAPTFEEIAPALANFIQGRVIAAHNLPFDSRMLAMEFDRIGASLDQGRGVCTLRLTHSKLEIACKDFGIENENAHRALNDARAAAHLAFYFADEIADAAPAFVHGLDYRDWFPRTLRRENVTNLPVSQTRERRKTLVIPTSVPEKVSYIDALDYFLDDLEISPDERQTLSELAADLGLTQDDQANLNRAYLDVLITSALRDKVITSSEQVVINAVADALEIDPNTTAQNHDYSSFSGEFLGVRVCFTGEVLHLGRHLDRPSLEQGASLLGMQPVASVTKKACDLLVAADPTSMSGKAKKARDWGIPVLGPNQIPGLLEASMGSMPF